MTSKFLYLNVRLIVMATCSTDRNFSAGLLYALKKLGTSCLNATKSTRDFSKDTIRCLYLIQIYKERPSSLETITSSKEFIQETQLFCTKSLHNRQTQLAMLKLV